MALEGVPAADKLTKFVTSDRNSTSQLLRSAKMFHYLYRTDNTCNAIIA